MWGALLAVALLLVAAAVAAWTSQRGGEDAPRPVAVRQALERDGTPGSPGPTPTPPPPQRAAGPTPAPTEAAAEPSPARPDGPETAIPLPPPPAPEAVVVEPPLVGNGEAMVVSVLAPGAAFATLRYRGEAVPLLAEGDLFWGVVAVPIAAEPGPALLSIETRGASGRLMHVVERGYEVVLVERPVDYLQLPESVTRALLSPEARAEEGRLRAEQFSTYDRSPRWETAFRIPAVGVITTEFGSARSVNGGPVGTPHTGTDVANALGTPVIAAAPGRVAWVGEMPIRGRSIIVDHGAGVMSGYHHLEAVEVPEGGIVEVGQVIGAIGSTGLSTGPHLHWEITVWGTNVDPLLWAERRYRP